MRNCISHAGFGRFLTRDERHGGIKILGNTINIVNVKLTDDCHIMRCGFKCVVNKLISNCGLSLQPDQLFIY